MVQPGDKVAIVSPSSGLPEIFPAPYELGLQRLHQHRVFAVGAGEAVSAIVGDSVEFV